MSRRLPIYFVLDCSESMVGDNLIKMEEGLAKIVRELRTDPNALESVYISIIAFAGIAKTIVPLIELPSFYAPKLPLGSGTNLGDALYTLMNEIDKSVIRTTSERKGDWKPIIYLFTDGRPTDNPMPAINNWKNKYTNKANLIAVSLGNTSDLRGLKLLSDNVLVFEESTKEDFEKFIKWITASITAQSKSVGDGNKDMNSLLDIDENVLTLVKDPPSTIADETCVTFTGRCQTSKAPYLIKYEIIKDLVYNNYSENDPCYELTGCYPITEEYFTWSELKPVNIKVNTNELIGTPSCPHCGAASAFAVCGCGNLLCINGPSTVVCPWCEESVSFNAGSANQEGFDVARGRG